MKREEVVLFSGGIQGAEAEFGAAAERFGIAEVNFSFEGHNIVRHRGLRVLTPEELQKGDVSLEYVSRLMNRLYSESPAIRKVLQSIWYQVNSGQEIYVIGEILADNTVKGGTGWGAEFAKLCNKELRVFDQQRNGWFSWNKTEWREYRDGEGPVISHNHVTGTGTRFLKANGQKAIADLFARSFA